MAAIILALTATPGRSSAATAPSRQVVFSGIGRALDGDFRSFVGFWIWCAAEGAGPYEGTCKGAMYVYQLGINVGVHGYVTEEADGTYTMHVVSNKNGVLSANVHNVSPDLNHGPNNTVEFDVTIFAGTSSGDSTDSVVVVSGPGD
jgi:hypothetical protein